jgi:hypothetical protein
MPLKRDPQGGGTDADGTRSTRYCSHCYQQGRFTQPDLTVDQMQVLAKGKLKELGFPGLLAGFLTRNIPQLERWKSH